VIRARAGIRELLGFLYSTPAYWPTLDLYGWGEVGRDLHAMTREGRWPEMSARISDEMLEILVPSAPYAEIADVLSTRFEGLATRMTFPLPEDPTWDGSVRDVIAALSGGG
jgi:hypothetical protein